MPVQTPFTEPMQQLADEHRQWLSQFHPQYSANWEKGFSANVEAAMTEAAVRLRLQQHGVTVEPNEDLTGCQRRPDFRCHQNGVTFFVEVVHISIEKAVEKTGISDGPMRFAPVRPLNDAIWQACRGNKSQQCRRANGPVLLAVGTWHSFAAMGSFQKPLVSMLLTGETMMAWDIDASGEQVGETYQITRLRSAAFLKAGATFASNSISGFLLIACGLPAFRAIGGLHPNPLHAFDPSLLSEIEFGELDIDDQSGQLVVRWRQRQVAS